MKKFLFASTALVAAGMMNAGAADAADKIKLNLGGYSKWWVMGAWQDEDHLDARGLKATNFDVKGANEINFSGSTKLDNGLTVGVFASLTGGGHSDMTTDPIDASYAWVQGGFGKVLLGNHPNAIVLTHVTAPDAAHGQLGASMMGANFAVNRTANRVMGLHQRAGWTTSTNTTAPIDDNKAEKISYIAPSFMGLTLGATLVPSVVREDTRAQPGNRALGWGVGGVYANTFGPVGLKVSGGYLHYNLFRDTNGAEHGIDTLSTGAQLSYAGFTLGSSWTRATHDQARTVTSAGNVGATSNLGGVIGGVDWSLQKGGSVDYGGQGFDIGLQYASGPYAVSFVYFHSEVEGAIAFEGKDTINMYQASGKYNIGPGVDILAMAGYAEYQSELSANGSAYSNINANSGYAFGTGLSLTF
ncbi:porin [Magnetospirillum sp. SS-4]|uniref:porin n=1 Tax=Magnetospirillum sp. SS-4 TaxID=2681465 RepID=UPI00137F1766|nr:porin [Magnetospirillum sp. SS-4]CAA7621220.1 conserved exported hypothetical protein [Magnetospirillum sp. SS-4]